MKRADQRKFHYLYKISRFDGKYYFGIHSTDDLEDGYFGSGTYLWKSLNKHGKEKHFKEILEFFETRRASKDKEKQILTAEMRADIKCMNIAPGGGGGFIDEAHQLKASRAAGKKLNLAFCKGSDLAKERNAKTAATIKYKIVSGELKSWSADNFRGKKHTEEAKAKMKASHAGLQSGPKNSQYGTCWVTNGEPIKIKKKQLDEYLANGYLRGRKYIPQ